MEEPDPSMLAREEWEQQLDRIKWHLWHSNVFRALQLGETLQEDLERAWKEQRNEPSRSATKALHRLIDERGKHASLSRNRPENVLLL